MTIGCEDSNLQFKPCADCFFEYQPKGCREHKEKEGSRMVYKSVDF